MKKSDSEFLRRYYSFFVIDYEHVVESLFMCRVWLIASVLANAGLVALIVIMCLFLESCSCIPKDIPCKPAISLRADNEHVSKRGIANYGNQVMLGFSCII